MSSRTFLDAEHVEVAVQSRKLYVVNTYGDSYFGDLFGVEFLGNEETELYNWMNVSVRNDDAHPMLLIHTPQFSDAISDRYIEQIAKRVVDFAREHKINLLPEE